MEETFDPKDWEELKAISHRMLDDTFDHLAGIRNQPAWRAIPLETKAHFAQPLPTDAQDVEETYQEFLQHIRPYPKGNIHPRFWGWVIGTGTPVGILAEMLSAGMNSNVSGGEQSAVYVEKQVIEWCKEMLDYPTDASGILVSGGSMANLVGLTVARNDKAGFDVKSDGLINSGLTMYGSNQIHYSLVKSVEMLGMGERSLRRISVNDDFQIDIKELKEAIRKDEEEGNKPICIIGNAGTVNTAAFDDLQTLADICEEEGMWFHIDGAFGAHAYLSPKLRHLTAGMQRADSLAFDLHKWIYAPIEAACVLVRDKEKHHNSFSSSGTYLSANQRGLGSDENWFNEYGFQLSRGFRALKIWMSFKTYGIDKYRRLIQQNVDQTQYLLELVKKNHELQLLAPAPLNIVCFRYVEGGVGEAELNDLNRELLMRIHESGVAVPSHTIIDGKYAIRVANVNHRSRREDFGVFVETVLRLGKEVAESLPTLQSR